MDDLLWLRVESAFAVDGSLAVLCGLVLSSVWLAAGQPFVRRADTDCGLAATLSTGLKVFAGVLFMMLCLQFFLLTIDFCGQTSITVAIGSLPDVASTRAGTTSLRLCATAVLLFVATWMPSLKIRMGLSCLLLTAFLALHANAGHAAADGTFLSESLQFVHLASTSVWSGGVLVSGLLIASRLTDGTAIARQYLGRLSALSTYAVGLVLLTGIIKSYRATEGSLHAVRTTHWGHILLFKSAMVTLTVLLGARNRCLLSRWSSPSLRRVAVTLRAEAFCMIAVLLLSAWLANSPPPFD